MRPTFLQDVQRAPVRRELFMDNLLVRIHFIIEMIWVTGLAPYERVQLLD